MHLRTLRYFVAVADAGSMTAAAAAIPIAQPALTRQMRDLEAELGAPLLQRLPRGVRLTSAGVSVYESAQRMLAEAARMQQRVARSMPSRATTVVLGASPTLARLLLPGLMERCVKRVDGIALRSREAFTPALLEWLQRGIVDMAVVTNPDSAPALSLQPLLAEPFALVSHVDMRIPSKIPLLMTSLHRSIVERQLLNAGKQLNVLSEIDSVDSIRELVSRGGWATIMPVSVFKVYGKTPPSITLSEISGVQLSRNLMLASRTDSRPNPALLLMQELIDAEFSLLSRNGAFSFAAGAP
jgi:LysR family nitrogen assimilation transcriptional regulator